MTFQTFMHHIAALYLHISSYEKGYIYLEFLVVLFVLLVPPRLFYMLLRNARLNQWPKYGILLRSQVTFYLNDQWMINVFDFDLFNCDFEFCFSVLHYSLECILLTFSLSAAFVLYAVLVLIAVFIIVFHYIPLYGQTHIMCYIGVCSLVGSLSVCIIN